MSSKVGWQGKAYYGADRTAAGLPTGLVELGNVTDVTLNLEKGDVDMTTRANDGWEARAGGLKDGGVEFEMLYDPDDAGVAALFNAWDSGENISMAFLDGDSATGQGLVADFQVLKFGRNEPLREGMKIPVSLKPGPSTYPPEWYGSLLST